MFHSGTGPNDTIWGIGSHDTVAGTGPGPGGLITFTGDNLTVNGLSGGSDLIGVIGNNNTLSGDLGNDTIWLAGSNSTVTDSAGNNLIGVIGDHNQITTGPGNDTIWSAGSNSTVTGGAGNDLIGVVGDHNRITAGPGNDTVNVFGNGDTITGGPGTVNLGGTNHTLLDVTSTYADTVFGFDQPGGDRIGISATGHTVATLTVQNNQDTLITLTGGSTILLKGVINVDNTFFS